MICLLHLRRFEITSKSKAINAPAAIALTTANPAMGPPPRLVWVTVLAGPELVDVRDVEVPLVRLGECCESVAGIVTVVPVTVTVVVLGVGAGVGTNNVAPEIKGTIVLLRGDGSVNVNVPPVRIV